MRSELRPDWFQDVLRDLRHAVRGLRRAPGFTAVSTMTLALAIAAATAVFGVVNAVLIKPLAYPDAEALVAIAHTASVPADVKSSPTQLFTFREEGRVFESLGLWGTGTASVTGVGDPEQVRTLLVTDGTLPTIGVTPAAGRWLTREDDTPGTPATMMLSYGYWLRRFGGDRAAIGRTLIVDAEPREVIGIMPEGFRFLHVDADVILPYRFNRSRLFLRQLSYQGIARLKPGVTLAQANTDVARMIPIWLKAWPAPPGIDPQIFVNARFTPALQPLKQQVVGDVGNVLWVLLGTVGIVLLIACANVANLVLVRVEGLQASLAIRAALGASTGRLIRERLIEHLVLALAGGTFGLLLAHAALRLLVATGPASLPRLDEIGIDRTTSMFALAISLACGVLVGLLPIARLTRFRIGRRSSRESHAAIAAAAAIDLRSGGARTSSQSREHRRMGGTLVIVQVALALVLLSASGLMMRTFQALRAVQPGFTQPEHLQLVRLTIPAAQVEEEEQVLRMQQMLRERMATIPGVTTVSFTNAAPMEPAKIDNLLYLEQEHYAAGQIPPNRRFKFAAPGFFEAAGIRIVAGRDFTWDDLATHRNIVIISESFAREAWRNPALAIGQRVRANADDPWREIVGIAGDVMDDGVDRRAPAIAYWPVLMDKFWRQPRIVQRSVTFVIRSDRAGTESFANELRAAVWAVNPNLPLAEVRTQADLYDRSLARTSFTLVMLAIAAITALLLGLVGIYGVMAYAVTQRTREIGVRVALGAEPAQVTRMFVRDGLWLAGVGVACGLAIALPLARVMTSLLFGVTPMDPITYVAVTIGLIAAAAIASYVPARRATGVDPMVALRGE